MYHRWIKTGRSRISSVFLDPTPRSKNGNRELLKGDNLAEGEDKRKVFNPEMGAGNSGSLQPNDREDTTGSRDDTWVEDDREEHLGTGSLQPNDREHTTGSRDDIVDDDREELIGYEDPEIITENVGREEPGPEDGNVFRPTNNKCDELYGKNEETSAKNSTIFNADYLEKAQAEECSSILTVNSRSFSAQTTCNSEESVVGYINDAACCNNIPYASTARAPSATSACVTSSSVRRKRSRKKQVDVEEYEPGPLLNALYKICGKEEKITDKGADMEWINTFVEENPNAPKKEKKSKQRRRRPKRRHQDVPGEIQESDVESDTADTCESTNTDSSDTDTATKCNGELTKELDQQPCIGETESDTRSIETENTKKRKIKKKPKMLRQTAEPEIVYNRSSRTTIPSHCSDELTMELDHEPDIVETESDTQSIKTEAKKKRKIRRKTRTLRQIAEPEIIYKQNSQSQATLNLASLRRVTSLNKSLEIIDDSVMSSDVTVESDSGHNTSSWFDESTDTDNTSESNEDSQTEELVTMFDKSVNKFNGKSGKKDLVENLLDSDFLTEGVQLNTNVSHTESKSESRPFYSTEEFVSRATREMWERMNTFVRCNIELISSHTAICTPVKPVPNVTEIEIRGRSKCGQAFSEDVVMVNILSEIPECKDSKESKENQAHIVYGKVVAILERNRFKDVDHPVFICVLDEFEGHLMLPLCKTVPKVHILNKKVLKKYSSQKRNKIEVYSYNETKGTLDFKEYCNLKEEERHHYRFLVCYIQWTPSHIYPKGAVIGVLRSSVGDISTGLKVLDIQHQVPTLYKEQTVRSVEKMLYETLDEPALTSVHERTDLSDALTVFTVDPPGSKDIDDALSIETLEHNTFRVGVHIADVSSFIQKDDPIDSEAKERCTTFYSSVSNRTYHMLPEPLSQDRLSLKEGKKRAALSVFLKMDNEGKLIDRGEIKKTTVKSAKQFTYKEVQDILFQDSQAADEYLLNDIKTIFMLATHLRKRRIGNQMHAIRIEPAFTMGDEAEEDTKEAHYLVEEFMVLTNFTVADYLTRYFPKSVPLRCQNFPDQNKLAYWVESHTDIANIVFALQNIRLNNTTYPVLKLDNLPEILRFTHVIPIQTDIWNELKTACHKRDIRKIQNIIGTDERHPSQCIAFWEWVAFQETAKYRCSGTMDEPAKDSFHFQLGISPYTHFTSPIRRYVDIIIHRLVHATLSKETKPPYSPEEIEKICCQINVVAKRAKLYQKQCQVLSTAHRLIKKPYKTNGFVDTCSDEGVTIRIPELKNIEKHHRKISFHLLDVYRTPVVQNDFDFVSSLCLLRQMVEVQWQKRLYNIRKCSRLKDKEENRKCQELDSHKFTSFLRLSDWRDMLNCLVENKHDKLCDVVENIQSEVDRNDQKNLVRSCLERFSDVSSEVKDGLITNHLVKFRMSFHLTQVISLQLTAEAEKGILVPYIQCVEISDNVSFCLQHMDNPVKCLASYAVESAKPEYRTISEYLKTWLPIINMEAATNAVRNEDSATINNISVTFHERQGIFSIPVAFCDERDIDFGSMQSSILSTEDGGGEEVANDEDDKDNDAFKTLASSNYLCLRYKQDKNIWIAHAEMNKMRKKKKVFGKKGNKKIMAYEVSFKLHPSSPSPPVQENCVNQPSPSPTNGCCMEILMKAKVDRRMESVLKLLSDTKDTALSRAIALGDRIPNTDSTHRSIEKVMPRDVCLPELAVAMNNPQQEEAIDKALRNRFSLIQGPPGTGKTYTGVKLIYLFNIFNNKMMEKRGGMKNQIIFCGPSNKSVDLVAIWMLNKFGTNAPKMVRMYGQTYELLDFPVPGRAGVSKRSTRDSKPDKTLVENNAVLHFLIREYGKPYAEELKQYDTKFRSAPDKVTLQDIKQYLKILTRASVEELKNYDVIFCTTTLTANPKLLEATKGRVYQCIIDECGMCTEPETMVPIIATRAKQVVLIGDHKQLQPIIICRNAGDMGLRQSLFERYANKNTNLFTMLTAQYRMNPFICKFPSKCFYDGRLTTEPSLCWEIDVPLRLWQNPDPLQHIPIAFVHVVGEEETLTVSTEEGNEQSKSNKQEVKQVVRIFKYLVDNEHVNPEYIQILSQYNAQRHLIQEELKKEKFINIKVNTVVASQGGEWDYVLFSTVRSLPSYLIEPNPTLGWCRQNLGFITDEHQVNVALTRAKKGLIIIGNKELMQCDNVWKKLLKHYKDRGRVFTPETFPPSVPKRRKTKR